MDARLSAMPPSILIQSNFNTTMKRPPSQTMVIEPRRKWICVEWHGMWQYRDLLLLLVHRDFVSKYKQTILGPAWFVIQPLLMTATFAVIFGKVAGIPTEGAPPILFYLCGLLGWSYFAQNFQSTSTTLISNAALFGKVYFPRLIVPIASVISNLLALGIQFLTFLVFFMFFKFMDTTGCEFGMRWQVVLLPLLVLQIALFSLGVGLWFSALTAKYRDFQHLSTFLIQIWMYITPVIYPLSKIPESWRWLAIANPMAMPIEFMKYSLLGTGSSNLGYLAVSVVGTLVTLVSGLLVFQNIERTFVDTV